MTPTHPARHTGDAVQAVPPFPRPEPPASPTPAPDAIASYATTHAIARARERLGFAPDLWDWRQTALAIMSTAGRHTTDAILVARDATTETWLVRLGRREARVVWNPVRAVVVTVLPR